MYKPSIFSTPWLCLYNYICLESLSPFCIPNSSHLPTQILVIFLACIQKSPHSWNWSCPLSSPQFLNDTLVICVPLLHLSFQGLMNGTIPGDTSPMIIYTNSISWFLQGISCVAPWRSPTSTRQWEHCLRFTHALHTYFCTVNPNNHHPCCNMPRDLDGKSI